jgi:histone deacetylase 1/2
MANQFNTTVKIIQSDDGGEFVNQSLQDCFVSNGIIHRLSCHGTLEQNGLAERRYRYIMDTGLTLMAHASIPPRFWTTAFTTTVFLINRLPTSTLGNKSPYELVLGSPPSYTFLRVFGCAYYPLLTPFRRSKLDYKSARCVFLDYSTHHKGYQCLNMQTGRIYIFLGM